MDSSSSKHTLKEEKDLGQNNPAKTVQNTQRNSSQGKIEEEKKEIGAQDSNSVVERQHRFKKEWYTKEQYK